jgi:2-amino-4-hydroxy-6-hydroxymethyldihydropteridine diphosphokinase
MKNLQDSIDALNLLPMTSVTAVSNIYETDPVGYDNQDDFLNIVVEVETELNSDNLLGACLGIESGLGRVRTIKNGPRIIDIDLLLFGDETKNTRTLVMEEVLSVGISMQVLLRLPLTFHRAQGLALRLTGERLASLLQKVVRPRTLVIRTDRRVCLSRFQNFARKRL